MSKQEIFNPINTAWLPARLNPIAVELLRNTAEIIKEGWPSSPARHCPWRTSLPNDEAWSSQDSLRGKEPVSAGDRRVIAGKFLNRSDYEAVITWFCNSGQPADRGKVRPPFPFASEDDFFDLPLDLFSAGVGKNDFHGSSSLFKWLY